MSVEVGDQVAARSSPAGAAPLVAVFGGSFNPPHISHVLAVACVLATSDVAKVLVVPTYQHPFAKALAPYEDRLKMCELAVGWLPRVEISRVEQELGGESRTLRTIEHLHATHPEWNLRLVIGADILLEAKKWFGFDLIVEKAPLIVLGRAGVRGADAPDPLLPFVSSTEVRTKLASQSYDDLALLLPRDVLAYIREKGLYVDPQGEAGHAS